MSNRPAEARPTRMSGKNLFLGLSSPGAAEFGLGEDGEGEVEVAEEEAVAEVVVGGGERSFDRGVTDADALDDDDGGAVFKVGAAANGDGTAEEGGPALALTLVADPACAVGELAAAAAKMELGIPTDPAHPVVAAPASSSPSSPPSGVSAGPRLIPVGGA